MPGVPYIHPPNYAKTIYAREGQSKRIQCPVAMEGDGVIYVEWSKGSENIDYTWSRMTIREDNTMNSVVKDFSLKIKALRRSDRGVYSCKVASGYGSLDEPINFTLIVLGKDCLKNIDACNYSMMDFILDPLRWRKLQLSH